MQLTAIVAMSQNRLIGKDNHLPWHLPADLRHFKALTLGKTILMGRKTYESIGRVLPGRRNVILTRNLEYQVKDALIIHSLAEVLRKFDSEEEIMVIGGSELYREILPKLKQIYITIVKTELEGDSYFPALSEKEWRQVSCEEHAADAENVYAYSFTLWERI